MNVPLCHSPHSLLSQSGNLRGEVRREYLLKNMGHRAMFDYELSVPRYRETPDVLDKMAPFESAPNQEKQPSGELHPDIEMALRFQDLKEHAKHEALRIFAVLRSILVALDAKLGLNEGVFYLTMDEVVSLDFAHLEPVRDLISVRQKTEADIRKMGPRLPVLTLFDCEQGSQQSTVVGSAKAGDLVGTRVSGEGRVSGTAYVVAEEASENGDPLVGFQDGQVLVCQMVHPAWLPYVIRSGGVISEVGGFLSHMSIVAREQNIAMLVGCPVWAVARSGDNISVGEDNLVCVEKVAKNRSPRKRRLAGE
jgi:phosphohistidine swiveling domain-containing protein